MRKYWIGVATKDHVDRGVSLGICQLGHGKRSFLDKLKPNDVIIYYCTKERMGNKESISTFTGMAIIGDSPVYLEDSNACYRRKVDWLRVERKLKIKEDGLIDRLSFIKNKKSWGMYFRRGCFEIVKQDFLEIAGKMLGEGELNKVL